MTEQDRAEQAEVFDASIEAHEGIEVERGEEIQAVELVLAPTDQGPARLLEIAVRQDLDIDKLERLVAMKERWDAEQARKAYYDAMARFQKLLPSLEKDKHVHYETKTGAVIDYDHTSLGSIKKQIQEHAADCGLSYRWEFNDGPDLMEVTCIITHVDGHSERSSQSAPTDTSGHKNTIQGRQSTRTYLERSTVVGALGLMTADKDDDGRQGQVSGPIPEEAAKDLPEVPEGTPTEAPKPETPGKTDFEKQAQIYGYLCEICGIAPDKTAPLYAEDKARLSAELGTLTEFESGDEKIAGEKSLRNLKGKRLNVAIGKAKAKLGHSTAKDELLHLLDCPALSQEIADEFRKEADDKRHKEPWFRDQIAIVNGLIADAEREADKQGTIL